VVCWLAGGALLGLPLLLWFVSRAMVAVIDVREVLADPLTPPVILLAGAGVGWAVWAWLVYATVADLVVWCRRMPRRRPRLPVPLHTAVTGLTGSVVLLVNTVAGHVGGGDLGTATAAASAPTVDPQMPSEPST